LDCKIESFPRRQRKFEKCKHSKINDAEDSIEKKRIFSIRIGIKRRLSLNFID
jgi:hypothetical protein